MWIWYSLLLVGVCHLANSEDAQCAKPEVIVHAEALGTKLGHDLIAQLEEQFGEGWEDQVPILIEKLEQMNKNLDAGLHSEELIPEEEGSEIMMKKKDQWKKVLGNAGKAIVQGAGKAIGSKLGKTAIKVAVGILKSRG